MVRDREIRVFEKKKTPDFPLSAGVIALLVFFLAFGLRLALTILFWNKFGAHASQCIEVWFFYGIAHGSIKAPALDPTTMLLSILGFLVPEGYLYQATSLFGAALSSLAAALIFILGKEIHNKKIGLIAALLYSAMVSPLYYGITCFVHDLIQLPIFLGCLITFLLSLKSTGSRRVLWTISFITLFFLGTMVNIVIYIVLDIVAIVLFWRLFSLIAQKRGIGLEKVYAFFIGFVVLGAILVRLEILPSLIDRVLFSLPQGRIGTLDLVPMSAERIWMKYNILLFFLPFGIWKCLKRHDTVSFTLLLVSFFISTLIERGSRLLDFGVALTVAHGMLGWRKRESLLFPLSLLPILFYLTLTSSPLFDFRHFTSRTLFMAIASSPVLAGVTMFIVLSFVFILLLSFLGEKKGLLVVSLLFIIFNSWSTYTRFTPEQFASFGTTDAEYDAYVFLSGRERAPLYVFWDHAYFVQAVSGFQSISNAQTIDDEAEKMMLSDEESAAAYFSRRGVKYIVISTRDARLHLTKLGWQRDFRETLVFKLIEGKDQVSSFHKIFFKRDEKTGIVVAIFEIS